MPKNRRAQKSAVAPAGSPPPRVYWFKAKKYGWGWTPATWQGWVIMIGFIGLIWADFWRIESQIPGSGESAVLFLPDLAVLTAVLIGICWATGEKPSWRWG